VAGGPEGGAALGRIPPYYYGTTPGTVFTLPQGRRKCVKCPSGVEFIAKLTDMSIVKKGHFDEKPSCWPTYWPRQPPVASLAHKRLLTGSRPPRLQKAGWQRGAGSYSVQLPPFR
jgi:hypothetical protein